MPTHAARSVAFVLFLWLLPLTAQAQQPFVTDDADVTAKGKFHLQVSDEYDLLQRALYPAKPPEHDGRCKSSLRKRLRSVISCLWSFNNGLLEIGYRGSEQKKTKTRDRLL